MDMCVIIPHHRGRFIDQCLASVKGSVGVSYEVTVVTSDLSYTPPSWVKCIHSDDGPAGKRNLAVSLSLSPYMVFLDDDVEIEPYTLFNLWNEMEDHPQCGIGFGKLLKLTDRRTFDEAGSFLTKTGFLFSRAGEDQQDTGQFDKATRCLSGKSATAIARVQAYRESGGFDASYFILGEETDLSWRCWLNGWEVWYFPKGKAYHAFDTQLKTEDYYTLERIHYRGSRNYVSMLVTNLGLPQLVWTLPIHLCGWVGAIVGFVLTGEWARAKLIWKGLTSHNIGELLRKRREVQARRVISDSTLLPIILKHPPISYYFTRLSQYLERKLHG